uniref:Uncharacterized protein n=1 Tax=Meloidogyne enterolobii TaxID=390850 RepID=A0A6V7VAT0_MELEN|nr:unnamed protein product [Meloidogyne enterolobii]
MRRLEKFFLQNLKTFLKNGMIFQKISKENLKLSLMQVMHLHLLQKLEKLERL